VGGSDAEVRSRHARGHANWFLWEQKATFVFAVERAAALAADLVVRHKEQILEKITALEGKLRRDAAESICQVENGVWVRRRRHDGGRTRQETSQKG